MPPWEAAAYVKQNWGEESNGVSGHKMNAMLHTEPHCRGGGGVGNPQRRRLKWHLFTITA